MAKTLHTITIFRKDEEPEVFTDLELGIVKLTQYNISAAEPPREKGGDWKNIVKSNTTRVEKVEVLFK